jgi:oligopeptide/dipeptide ABC transporter ATP-binding protein
MPALLQLEAVEKHFTKKSFLGKNKVVRAVDGVSLAVGKGETLGIVGESGCGKSTLASLMIRLEQPTSGKIFLDGLDISRLSETELRPLRSRIQIVFQDPYSSLNPRFTVQQLVSEPMRVMGKWNKQEIDDKVLSLLELVGLSKDHLQRYPHEFSGGQRQRLSIARALTTDPEILILDEPTSALDVSVQAQVLNLLLKLQTELALTYIFISHNLSVVKYVSNRVAVMYFGKIVELGDTSEVLLHPLHPYTQELLAAVPAIGKLLSENQLEYHERTGSANHSQGCLYYPRCSLAQSLCLEKVPQLLEGNAGHQVACLEMKINV